MFRFELMPRVRSTVYIFISILEKQKQLRGMRNQPTNSQEREREEHVANIERQLQETKKQNSNLQNQLMRTEKQLTEKNEQQESIHVRLRDMEQQFAHFQVQLREKEVEETNLLREKEQQEENSRRQLRDMEQQLTNVQGQLQRKNEEATNLQSQVTSLEERLRTKDQDMNELETSLSTAQQALDERPRQQSPDWVISRDQIQLTDKFLGKGAWGSVVEGKYCGCAVAVKQIHELILSDHNRRLFEREMNIASRCRHPCLLQFVGATNDGGSPLFVTELMESSLRALLEQRPLSRTEVSVISLDVARALNYFHHKEPSPIIHRDISSTNVLLWRQADQWRAKVSDYGTANFMQQTMTVGPGAMIYSAPEALTKNQTVKVCLIYIFTFIVFDLLFVFTVTGPHVKELNHLPCTSLRWLKPVSLFFNTNSLMDRYHHTFSFVSLKIVSNKCPIIAQQVMIIFRHKATL